ncbi:NUDIX domain-containing protein [Microbacterium elymi]|uniref:NUDIX domain-containing protein n=1 Tax=Microbacterium elymi TaxID=2909587 RepID=UPI003F493107
MTYRDRSGRALEDYPRPSVAVDTAVLTVWDDTVGVLLLSDGDGGRRLPGTFVHPGERLADAADRALREKAGLTGIHPRQLARVRRAGSRRPRMGTQCRALRRRAVEPAGPDRRSAGGASGIASAVDVRPRRDHRVRRGCDALEVSRRTRSGRAAHRAVHDPRVAPRP